MKLFELISVVSTDNKIEVWFEDEILALYDGKNSLPVYFNNCEVIRINSTANALVVDIDLESVNYIDTDNDSELTLATIYRLFNIHNTSDMDFEEFMDCSTDMGGCLREV